MAQRGKRRGTPQRAAKAPRPAPVAAPVPTGPFRLGVVAGATPGRWIDTWRERMPRVEAILVPLEAATQRAALDVGEVDAALVRLPPEGPEATAPFVFDRTGLHLIRLYEEEVVVVAGRESSLLAVDELAPEDLDGEVLVIPADDVLGIRIAGTEPMRFPAPATTPDAIEVIAAGIGVTVVPMSLARLHHRRDVEYRPLAGAPRSPVGLAWPAESPSPLVETFIGIVRGRTARSSR